MHESSIKSRNEIGHFCKQPVLRYRQYKLAAKNLNRTENMADTIRLLYTTHEEAKVLHYFMPCETFRNVGQGLIFLFLGNI